jgi:hypothetical protein
MNTSNLDPEHLILDATPQVLTDVMRNAFMNNYVSASRKKRDDLLKETDKYLLSDYPITPEKLEEVKVYRQNLRNYMGLFNGNMQHPELPIKPSFITTNLFLPPF